MHSLDHPIHCCSEMLTQVRATPRSCLRLWPREEYTYTAGAHQRGISKSHAFYLLFTSDLTEPDVIVAAQPLLNGALDEDTLDDGWVRSVIAVIFLMLLIRRIDSSYLDLLRIEQYRQQILWKTCKILPGQSSIAFYLSGRSYRRAY